MPGAAIVSAGGAQTFATLRNNAHHNWWQDAGMRKLTIGIAAGFCGTVNAGYDGSLFNGLQTMPIFMNAIGHPDSSKLGIISAAYPLGGIPSMIPAAWCSDKYGRRLTMAIGAILIITGAVIQTATSGGNAMLATRFVIGLGNSFQAIGAGPYVSEVSHPRNRPQATALINTCWYIGSIIAAWACFGTLSINSSWCWRLPCLLQVTPCALQLGLLVFAKESPRFLISKGREEEALRVLADYHANGDADDELVQHEFREIKEAIEYERQATANVSYMTFFKTKGNRHRLLILVLVGLFSQWVGNGIISYYLAQILSSVGITSSTQQAGLNGGLQIWNWILAIGGSLLCERLGRRFLWLTSAIGMLLCYVSITVCSAMYAEKGSTGAGYATIAFLFLYFGSYDIAFTGLTLAYPQEILPFNLRSRGNAILQFTVSLALFFNQYVNPIALEALAWKYYIVYDCVIVVAIVCIYFLYPETKGLMLEEIAVIFDGDSASPTLSESAAQVIGTPMDEEKKLGGSTTEHMEYK